MSHRTNERKLVVDVPDLRQFTIDFFTRFGATLRKVDRRKAGALRVSLRGELAEYFAAQEMTLAFQHVDQGDGQELVAYGSRVFDRMMTYVERSSALTVQQLPKRFHAGDELLQAVRPRNARVAGLKLSEQSRRYFAFTWHITYRADDKREELYTVVIDEDGRRIPLAPEGPEAEPTAVDPALEADNGAGARLAGFDLSSAMQDGEDDLLAVDESDPAAEPPARKLPPMTHLARHAEVARKYAIYHADLRCVSHEADILPRLHKTLSRLIGYYQQQIDEVYDAHDPEFEQRRRLEADLERKIAEEVENHRLRVGVVLSSYAIFEQPVAVADLTLATAEHAVNVRALRNLYTGEFERPHCHACGDEAIDVAIDAAGHLSCAACLHHCATCGDAQCAACGIHICPVCSQENCVGCSQPCWACGDRACADHVTRCPTCGDSVCHACQAECAACGVRQCTSHLRLDAVLATLDPASDGIDDAEQHALICRTCAVRCPGCQQFSAQNATCSASGQRFCQNCIVACVECGRQVGPGFYERHPATDAPVCLDCLTRCANCNAIVAGESECSACAMPCCPSCGQSCQQCGQLFCTDDVFRIEPCGHLLCAQDSVLCHIGHEAVCPICSPGCAICGDPFCAAHSVTCQQCQLDYCSTCVNEQAVCASCQSIGHDGEVVDLTDEPCVDHPAVAEVAPHYTWHRLTNRSYIIYLGRGPYMSAAVVTVRQTPTGGEVIGVRELELDDLLRINFWRET